MTGLDWQNAYLRLHPKAALKYLETPFVYHIGRDELYDIDERAKHNLRQGNGTRKGRHQAEANEGLA